MKHFIIYLKIQTGEYEKTITTLQQGENEQDATVKAMLCQCHCALEEGADWLVFGEELEDLYGEFIYTVYDCEEVPQEEANILKKYL